MGQVVSSADLAGKRLVFFMDSVSFLISAYRFSVPISPLESHLSVSVPIPAATFFFAFYECSVPLSPFKKQSIEVLSRHVPFSLSSSISVAWWQQPAVAQL